MIGDRIMRLDVCEACGLDDRFTVLRERHRPRNGAPVEKLPGGLCPGPVRNIAYVNPDALTAPELMGAREAAECLGCSVANLGRQANLPEPVAELSCGRIWLADEIRTLAKERGRR